MKDDFSFPVSCAGITVMVLVRDHTVTLRDVEGVVTTGIWDAGRYVRYARSQALADVVPPALLDAIDLRLRERLRAPGKHTERIPPAGHSKHR